MCVTYRSLSDPDLPATCNPFFIDCAKFDKVFDWLDKEVDATGLLFWFLVGGPWHWWSIGNRCFTQNACRQSEHSMGTSNFAWQPRKRHVLDGLFGLGQLFWICRLTYDHGKLISLNPRRSPCVFPRLATYSDIGILIPRTRHRLFANWTHWYPNIASFRICPCWHTLFQILYRTSSEGSLRPGHRWSSSLKCSWLFERSC